MNVCQGDVWVKEPTTAAEGPAIRTAKTTRRTDNHRGDPEPSTDSRPAPPGSTADLRRLRRRDQVEQLMARAAYLAPEDLALLRLVYEDGRPVAHVALVLGRGRAGAAALRRRVRRLVERLGSPVFAFVARRRDEWPATRRRIATAIFLHGCSARQVARRLGLTIHTVRRHHDAVIALFEAEQAGARR